MRGELGGGASELNLSGVRESHAAISTIFGYVVFFVQKTRVCNGKFICLMDELDEM